ncbi:hypothetical protein BH10ACI1_BH10ACI1_20300 [soil metagenome]
MPDYSIDAGLLEHLQKQRQSIEQYKVEADADGADITELGNDVGNMEAIMDFCPLADEYKATAFGIKKKLIRGNIGDSVGVMMTAPTFAPPAPLVAGIEKRSRERDGRFKRSKTMTEAALLALDLVDTPANVIPGTIKPTFDAHPAQMGYESALVIANRGESDMWKALGQKANAAKWFTLTSGTGKSGNVTIEPTTEGQPERILVMIQLYKNNEPYGQPSDPQYVTFNP